jgi:hypothetical protein
MIEARRQLAAQLLQTLGRDDELSRLAALPDDGLPAFLDELLADIARR